MLHVGLSHFNVAPFQLGPNDWNATFVVWGTNYFPCLKRPVLKKHYFQTSRQKLADGVCPQSKEKSLPIALENSLIICCSSKWYSNITNRRKMHKEQEKLKTYCLLMKWKILHDVGGRGEEFTCRRWAWTTKQNCDWTCTTVGIKQSFSSKS